MSRYPIVSRHSSKTHRFYAMSVENRLAIARFVADRHGVEKGRRYDFILYRLSDEEFDVILDLVQLDGLVRGA